MKETRQLSIGGYAFVLEVDAAEELRRYMDAMEKHYLPQEGGKEIMEGIEERIAELLLDKHASVVNSLHVQEVINVIGRPESIDAEEPAAAEEPVVEEPVAAETRGEEGETSANTFDFGIIAAVASVISLAGFAASKKKH